MSASLQSAPVSERALGDRRLRQHHPVSPISPHLAKRGHSAVVRSLPNSRYRPLWVRSLVSGQRFSSTLAVGLALSVLTVYGQTVYSQQLWDQEYQRLETLRRLERQLKMANAVLKEQVAQQAVSPLAGFVQPTIANTIFLPLDPRPVAPPPVTVPIELKPVVRVPLGY